MNKKGKAPAARTAKGLDKQFKFDFDHTHTINPKQAQTCPRCARDINVPWLLAIIYTPLIPVRVLGFCASCAGDLRYANLTQQRAICDEIAEHTRAGRRAAY